MSDPRTGLTRMPSAGYSITVRVTVPPDPSAVGRLTTAVGASGGVVTALDVVESHVDRIVIDLSCDTSDGAHAERITTALNELDGVVVRKVSDRTFLIHLGGKIEVASKVSLRTRDELSLARDGRRRQARVSGWTRRRCPARSARSARRPAARAG